MDLPFLEGSRPSCTAGIVLRTFSLTHTHTHTSSPVFTALFLSHKYTLGLAHVPRCRCARRTVRFLKVPAGLALPGTVDAASHVNLELETDVELCSEVTLAAAAAQLSYPYMYQSDHEKKNKFL